MAPLTGHPSERTFDRDGQPVRGTRSVALSSRELSDIERRFPEGLSSKQIIELLAARGEPLTEATLRKYVQLGLLPRSRRVGEKGKHRGSRGIYPVEVIRRIDEVRRAMVSGETLEELAQKTQAVRAKLASVRVSVHEVLDAAQIDLSRGELDRLQKISLKSEFTTLSRQAHAWLRSMERWASTLKQAEERRTNGKTAKKMHLISASSSA